MRAAREDVDVRMASPGVTIRQRKDFGSVRGDDRSSGEYLTLTRFVAFGIALALSVVAPLLSGGQLSAQAASAATPINKKVSSALQWGPCPAIFPTGCQIAVLHGDPSKPNADVFLRVPGGYTIPAHSHTSAERMILIEGQLTVKYKGAPAAALTAGEYAFGPAGLPHDAKCAAGKSCTLFIAFEGPVDATAFIGSLK